MRSIDDSFDMLGPQHIIYTLRQIEILDGSKAVLSVAIAGFWFVVDHDSHDPFLPASTLQETLP